MSSLKQINANRLNALKGTGPKTSEGKERSRCNAIRHGLTAETVIVGSEDADDYEAFEAAVIADHDAQSAVERELVLRLASVLWRIRRATGIETSLFEFAINHSCESELFNRTTTDLLLSQLFLDRKYDSNKPPSNDSIRKKQIFADIRAFDRNADLSNEPAKSIRIYPLAPGQADCDDTESFTESVEAPAP